MFFNGKGESAAARVIELPLRGSCAFRQLVLQLAVALGLVTDSVGQAGAASAGDPGYIVRSWETVDGLPENSATAITQTPDGYLWFGSFNGLVRFNGAEFKVF